MYHTGIIIITQEQMPILIEYGQYNEEKDTKSLLISHYYIGYDGLRFTILTENLLNSIKENTNNKCVHCNVDNQMTIQDLLQKVQNKDGSNRWGINDYNVVTHNCQNFVCETLDILNASANSDIDDLPTLLKVYRLFT